MKRRNPILTTLPLAKEGVRYPFSLPTIPAWGWRKAKAQLGLQYKEKYSDKLLWHLSEFIRDVLHSTELRNVRAYDHSKILNLAEGFYGGNSAYASELDWWLTFELWRRNIQCN